MSRPPSAIRPMNARLRLLSRLLEAHERSASYARPAPWRRDALLKLTAREFPTAFAPDGREELAALKAAAEELAAAGAVRLDRHRGHASGEIRQLRLGPSELERAYALAGDEGFEPLELGLRAVAERAAALRERGAGTTGSAAAGTLPDWMARYLDQLGTLPATADASLVGMARPTLKARWPDLLDALTAAAALSGGAGGGWERVISERLLGHSKRIGELRALVAALLHRADPQWDGIVLDEPIDVLEAYGVRRKPGLIRCAGAGALDLGPRQYLLEDFTPTAHLPDAWASAWLSCVERGGTRLITTIENEYPFIAYVEEAGGPAALGARGEMAIYLAGFPTPALLASLTAAAAIGVAFRHWGDADVGGLRIWWKLRSSLGRPVPFFRTDRAWVELQGPCGGRPLRREEREALARLRRQLEAAPWGGEADARQALELIAALETGGRALEQERYLDR